MKFLGRATHQAVETIVSQLKTRNCSVPTTDRQSRLTVLSSLQKICENRIDTAKSRLGWYSWYLLDDRCRAHRQKRLFHGVAKAAAAHFQFHHSKSSIPFRKAALNAEGYAFRNSFPFFCFRQKDTTPCLRTYSLENADLASTITMTASAASTTMVRVNAIQRLDHHHGVATDHAHSHANFFPVCFGFGGFVENDVEKDLERERRER